VDTSITEDIPTALEQEVPGIPPAKKTTCLFGAETCMRILERFKGGTTIKTSDYQCVVLRID